MNPWLGALVGLAPRHHSTAALPLLLGAAATLGALAGAGFAPPTRAELERSFGAAWRQSVCAGAPAPCQIRTATEPVSSAVASAAWSALDAAPALGGARPWSRSAGEAPARLVVMSTVPSDQLRSRGAAAQAWPRMKSAVANARIQAWPSAAPSSRASVSGGTPAAGVRRKRP